MTATNNKPNIDVDVAVNSTRISALERGVLDIARKIDNITEELKEHRKTEGAVSGALEKKFLYIMIMLGAIAAKLGIEVIPF